MKVSTPHGERKPMDQQHDKLTPQEHSVLDRFYELSKKVTPAVATVKAPKEKDTTLADVDRLISGLQSLARSDPAAYHMLDARLQNALGANDHGQKHCTSESDATKL